MKFEKILKGEIYYTVGDLRYTDKAGKKLSGEEIRAFLEYKDAIVDKSDFFVRLNLKSYNSRNMFYADCEQLRNLYDEYINLINAEDVYGISEMLGNPEMERARIYSEVEGSIKIEGYNSTRKLFDDIRSGAKKPENMNEFIIRNMAAGINYVNEAPDFNEQNIRNLYGLLSADCLDDNQKLHQGALYRHDQVYISTYAGAAPDIIEDCMKSVIAFANESLKSGDHVLRFMAPHIVHYYIVYVHPYFDCNGRMARMCSLWVSELLGTKTAPYYISEAINDTKRSYYRALSQTRDTGNDLTYFLIYILQTSIRYGLCYRFIMQKQEELAKEGEYLTQTEVAYLKRSILCAGEAWFTWKDFIRFTGTKMSKQGALKFMNSFERLGIAKSKINSKREKVFRIIDAPA